MRSVEWLTIPFGKPVQRGPYRRIAQARQRDDLHDLDGFLMQPNDLLAPLMKLFQCLFSPLLVVGKWMARVPVSGGQRGGALS